MGALKFLTQTIAGEKFSTLLRQQDLEEYISENFSEQALMKEINRMSNQYLVVYSNNTPAGFALITSKGIRPKSLTQKRAIRIADFGILKEYDTIEIKQSLLDKCLSVCKFYDSTWINEYAQNPLIPFFESAGFIRQDEVTEFDELQLKSVCLIK